MSTGPQRALVCGCFPLCRLRQSRARPHTRAVPGMKQAGREVSSPFFLFSLAQLPGCGEHGGARHRSSDVPSQVYSPRAEKIPAQHLAANPKLEATPGERQTPASLIRKSPPTSRERGTPSQLLIPFSPNPPTFFPFCQTSSSQPVRCLEAVNTLPSPVQRSAAGRSSPGLCLPVPRLPGGRRQPREPAGRERGAPGAVPSMRPAPRSLPALLCCCSAGLLLLLLRWRRWKRLWEKVEAARQRQEEGLDRMDKAVRSFREQVGARSRAGRSNGEGEGGRWVGAPPS